MSPITTHVLDTSRGCPAKGLSLSLSRLDEAGSWCSIADGVTNEDGRVTGLMESGTLIPGIYQMYFDTGAYHQSLGLEGFYPEARITFEIKSVDQHYHIPLLLSPYGYSTYRGS